MANKGEKNKLDIYCEKYGLSEQDKKDLRNACSEYVVYELKENSKDFFSDGDVEKWKSAWNWLNTNKGENQFSYDITLRKLRQMKEDYPKLKQVKDKEGNAIDIDKAYEDEVDNYCIQIIFLIKDLTTQSKSNKERTKFQKAFAEKYSLNDEIIAKLNNDTLLNYTIQQIHYRTLARKTRILLRKYRTLACILLDQKPYNSYVNSRINDLLNDVNKKINDLLNTDLALEDQDNNEEKQKNPPVSNEIPIRYLAKRLEITYKEAQNLLKKIKENDPQVAIDFKNFAMEQFYEKLYLTIEIETITQLKKENKYLYRSGGFVEEENLEASNRQSDMPLEYQIEQGSKTNTSHISTSKSPLIMLTYYSPYKESDSQADTTRHSKYLAINLDTLLSDLTKRLDEINKINSQCSYDQEYELYKAIKVYLENNDGPNKKLLEEISKKTATRNFVSTLRT